MDDLEIPPWQETPKSTHNGIEDDKIMQYLCVGMLCYGMDRVWLPKTSIRINSEKRLVVLQPYLAEIKQGWNIPKPTGPLGPWALGPLGIHMGMGQISDQGTTEFSLCFSINHLSIIPKWDIP